MPIQLTKQCVAPELTKVFVDRIFMSTGRHVRYPKAFTISVVAVGDVEMKKMNNQYRQVNEVTDVLSFPYEEQGGEVVIDYAQAKRQANSKQTSITHELSWLLIHGILHVLGYDHETTQDAQVMRPLERTILQAIWPAEYTYV